MTYTQLLAFSTIGIGAIVLFLILAFFSVKLFIDLFKTISFRKRYKALNVKENIIKQNDMKKTNNIEEVEYKNQIFSYELQKPLKIKNVKGYGWLDNSEEEYEQLKSESTKVVNIKNKEDNVEQLPFNF